MRTRNALAQRGLDESVNHLGFSLRASRSDRSSRFSSLRSGAKADSSRPVIQVRRGAMARNDNSKEEDLVSRLPNSPLQRICELQKEASIADNLIARLHAAGDLRLPAKIFTERNATPAELIRAATSRVNKRLVLVVAKNCGIGQRNRIFDRSSVYRRSHVHIFLQLLAGITGFDARLKRSRIGIQRRRLCMRCVREKCLDKRRYESQPGLRPSHKARSF